MPDPVIYFQWQNEYLLTTIYPMRETKLRDFLQYYDEIEIWQQYKNKTSADIAGEVQKFRDSQKKIILEAYNNFQKLNAYFLDEDVTDTYRAAIPDLDLDTMAKINDIHKIFKRYFPTYQNPVKEKYFTSERARQLEETRKRIELQIKDKQRILKILPATSAQKPNYEAGIAQLTRARLMVDRELDQLYGFLKAYARLDVYKQEAIKRKTAREKERDTSSDRLRGLKTEIESLETRLAQSRQTGRRLSTPPDLEAAKAYFLDEDVSDEYRVKIPLIDPATLQKINALHKTFKSILPTYKNPSLERNFLNQRITELENTRKLRAQELAEKQRAATWLKPGTPGGDANEKTISTLKNNVLSALDEELNKLYDLRWAYEAGAKSPAEISALVAQNQKERTDIESQLKAKKDSAAVFETTLVRLGQELGLGEKEQMLALVDALPVSVQDIVRGKVEENKAELDKKAIPQLLEAIVQRFVSQPERYPLWLQYMVIHFSGMRYQSAHGSWADPKDLLLSLRIKAIQDEIKRQGEEAVINLCDERFQCYQLAGQPLPAQDTQPPPALALASEPRWKEKVGHHLQALDPSRGYYRKKALIDLRIDEEEYEISRMTDKQALEQLEGLKDQLPDWMWKEIVKMTDLRLKEVRDDKWEQVTTEDMAKRYTQQMAPYREILENWKRTHLTGWREEHDRTSQLIVTRAVCNEVAEHIQHLRGHSPSGGLTAKPEWYMRKEKDPRYSTAAERALFIKAKNPADFKVGASILWLQWVNKEPNAWQIARPLVLKTGEELIPVLSDANSRITNTGSSFVRNARYQVKDASGAVTERNEHQWLRWLHEATVVDVAETMDGPTILTFETALPYEPRSQSTIGVFKHPASYLKYNVTASTMSGVFVGYVPEGDVDYEVLHEMLDWNHILLKNAYTTHQIEQYWAKVTRPPQAAVSFGVEAIGQEYLVEAAPQFTHAAYPESIYCFEPDSQTGRMELYRPEVELRRGMHLWVNKGSPVYFEDQVFYPVQRCDDEPRAQELYVTASEIVDVPVEGSTLPVRVKTETALLRICGLDKKGRPVFEETRLNLEKGTRLLISTVQKIGSADTGNGVIRARGRQACYLVQECPVNSRAEGLFIRTSAVRKTSFSSYRRG